MRQKFPSPNDRPENKHLFLKDIIAELARKGWNFPILREFPSLPHQIRQYPPRGFPIPIEPLPDQAELGLVAGVRHGALDGRADLLDIRAHQLGQACFHAFGAFGDFAHDDDAFAESCGFFLHAAGIGEDAFGAVEQVHEGEIIDGRDEVDVLEAAQALAHHRVDVRIEVHRIDDFEIAAGAKFRQRFADTLEAAAKTFAAVAGDQEQAARAVDEVEGLVQPGAQSRVIMDAVDRLQKRVDHRIAGDDDAVGGEMFLQQVTARGLRRRVEMFGDEIDGAAVHLFGIGPLHVIGAQARFDMAHRNALVKGRKGRRHGRGGVAMDQHHIGRHLVVEAVDLLEDQSRKRIQRMAGAHQLQIVVGLDGENLEHLVEHLAVLAGGADHAFHGGRGRQGLDDGGHFDGLGPGTDDRENTDCHGRAHSGWLAGWMAARNPL